MDLKVKEYAGGPSWGFYPATDVVITKKAVFILKY